MTPHITRGIKIRNFKGIKEGELKPSPLTILIGPNKSIPKTCRI